MRELTYAQALNEALRQCMAEDERVILLGEDIGVYGGIFQVTVTAVVKSCGVSVTKRTLRCTGRRNSSGWASKYFSGGRYL